VEEKMLTHIHDKTAKWKKTYKEWSIHFHHKKVVGIQQMG
jgi:hypothetical protein